MAKTSFYVTVEPVWTGWNREQLQSIRATAITQRKPNRQTKSGTIVVKLDLEIPNSAFLPLRPQVAIVVPEDMVKANLPITVEAVDQDEDEASD